MAAARRQKSIDDALTRDPPLDDIFPARTLAQAIPSGGANLNALLYVAAGQGPHPTVLLLHGLPGNEENIDLAQAMRRAGWNVLKIHYQGSWGSEGSFSFAQSIEDAAAALSWLLSPALSNSLRIDPAALVVIGHSMGGFIAAHIAAHEPAVVGAVLISPADLGSAFGDLASSRAAEEIDENVGTSKGLHILDGTSPEGLAQEAQTNAEQWRLENFATQLAPRPLLLCTSDDGFAAGAQEFATRVAAAGGKLSQTHFNTDHSYSDQRIALQREVLDWLSEVRELRRESVVGSRQLS